MTTHTPLTLQLVPYAASKQHLLTWPEACEKPHANKWLLRSALICILITVACYSSHSWQRKNTHERQKCMIATHLTIGTAVTIHTPLALQLTPHAASKHSLILPTADKDNCKQTAIAVTAGVRYNSIDLKLLFLLCRGQSLVFLIGVIWGNTTRQVKKKDQKGSSTQSSNAASCLQTASHSINRNSDNCWPLFLQAACEDTSRCMAMSAVDDRPVINGIFCCGV